MNDSKITILGLGAVSRSLINLLIREKAFSFDDIRVADMSEEAYSYFSSIGGKKENFINVRFDSKNYLDIFADMKKGDFLVRLANGFDDTFLAKECMERGIHFISTSDDTFQDIPFTEPFRYRTHFYRYKELMEQSKGCATSVLQFGMNPGLISILTKKALIDIVENDEGSYVTQNRDRLRQLIDAGDFPLLAKELKVTSFVVSDLDSTQADITEDENTLYNTWNVDDFFDEMNDRSILKVGSLVSLEEHLKRLGVLPEQVYYYNRYDGTLVLDVVGKDLKTEAYACSGTFAGCVDAHEEIFSIHDYYTIRDSKDEVDYAPSVMFVYRSSDLAMNSVYRADVDLYNMGKYQTMIITNDRMTAGTEAVGAIAEGKNFSSVYVGIAPDYNKDGLETPSILEVSASVYAAILYISKHPCEGIMLPEYLDVSEILSHTERFLPVISKRI